MKTTATAIKQGMYLNLDSNIYQVVKTERNFRGRGSAQVKLKLKHVATGTQSGKTFKSDKTLEVVSVQTRPAQFLYADSQYLHIMDREDFTQYQIPRRNAETLIPFLKQGARVHVVLHDGRALTFIPPKRVKLTVTQAHAAVKGDTATGAKKTVVVETGATITVPLFIQAGETVIVNAQTGEYIGRI